MRPIKFRAWNGERMINDYSSYSVTPEGWVWFGVTYPKGVKSVMQFTGLLDKNGKEIYEGDIFVSTENNEVFVVGDILPLSRHLDYLAENIGYFTDTKRKKFKKRSGGGQYHLDDWVSNPEFYDVIGNIYENPELLK